MKMMGLMDSTYYLGWFILYSLISGFNALVISICLITQLDKINPVFIFMFAVYATIPEIIINKAHAFKKTPSVFYSLTYYRTF